MVLKVEFHCPKNYIVSGFLVIFNQRLQNHEVAKVDYVWEYLPTIITPSDEEGTPLLRSSAYEI